MPKHTKDANNVMLVWEAFEDDETRETYYYNRSIPFCGCD